MGVSGAVFAGGRSRRLGADKALLATSQGPLIAGVVALLAERCSEVLVVVDRAGRPLPDGLGARKVVDETPGLGPLAGLLTALRAAGEERCLVMACDLPFVRPAVLDLLLSKDPADAVVPRAAGYMQPLLAIYRKTCLFAIEAMLGAGELRMDRLMERVTTSYVDEAELRAVDPELHSFFNINDPADLQRARELGL